MIIIPDAADYFRYSRGNGDAANIDAAVRSFAVHFHQMPVVMNECERIAIYVHSSDSDKVPAAPDQTWRICTHYVPRKRLFTAVKPPP